MTALLLHVIHHLPANTVGLLDLDRAHLAAAGQTILRRQAKDAHLQDNQASTTVFSAPHFTEPGMIGA
jgi:hypothetical protein